MKIFNFSSDSTYDIRVHVVVDVDINTLNERLKEIVFYNLSQNFQWNLLDNNKSHVEKVNNFSEYIIYFSNSEQIKINMEYGTKISTEEARKLWTTLVVNGLKLKETS